MLIGMDGNELERLAGVVRREAILHSANAKASAISSGGFEESLNAERIQKAADLRKAAELLEDCSRLARRAHLQVVA